MGLFDNIKQGWKKTKDILHTDLRDLFKQEGRLVDEDFLEQVLAILVRTDMGLKPAREIVAEVGSQFRGRKVHLEDELQTVKEKLRELMPSAADPITYAAEGPTVVMVVGVNGSGKTTSIAKLARMFKSQGKSVVLGAGDTFRAAAVEQLTIWAERLDCPIVTGKPGGDPASVAHRAVAEAKEIGADVCIVDTAGRQQTQHNLMQQLEKIHRVMGKLIPESPHEVILVLDATTGQNGLAQAQGFSEASHCTGLFLAKLDGTARGGVVVAIRQQFDLPVKFVGVGETPDDLAIFDADQFVEALFADAS
ncbi:MAG: signal recognition particle-docking protein FtsY [Planctomycetales bacterium]